MRILALAVFAAGLQLHPVVVVEASAEVACSGVEGNDPEIAATHIDNFARFHSVGGEAWISFDKADQLIFHLCSVDNEKDFLIAQNAAGNDHHPGKFSRFEWLDGNGQLFYCQQVFDAESAEDAADFELTPAADRSDPNDRGCGPAGRFPWSQLVAVR